MPVALKPAPEHPSRALLGKVDQVSEPAALDRADELAALGDVDGTGHPRKRNWRAIPIAEHLRIDLGLAWSQPAVELRRVGECQTWALQVQELIVTVCPVVMDVESSVKSPPPPVTVTVPCWWQVVPSEA